MTPIISATNLGKKYVIGSSSESYGTLRDSLSAALRAPFGRSERDEKNSVWALRDVSFEVQQGEVVGLIGRNGAGKSTLLKLLARITEPSAGRAVIGGRVASLLEVGTGFHPELSGRENIFLNGAILGMSRREIERKFDEIVAFSEVEKYLDTPVKRYSSGMFMRLAFAVAAHLEPEILLVDEVLAVGDLAFQKKCLGKMGEVASQGRTIFFVSHNMGSISALCNKAIYLSKGTVKQMGPAEEVVREFLSEMLDNRVEDIDLLRQPSQGNAQEIRFCDIRLASPEGSAGGTTLLFGQPITYALTVRSQIEASDLSIGSSIFNSSSGCVGTLFSRDKFSLRAGETRTLHLTVSNANLAPGRYYAGFSVGRGGGEVVRHDFDTVVGKPAFEVSAVAADQGPIAHWNSAWGNIVLNDNSLTFAD
jgi:lipopolysaccharide transport system ATP-binding protein